MKSLTPKVKSSKGFTINHEKRAKLRDLLITKFSKKFGLPADNSYLTEQITKFLSKESINDSDMKLLEQRISRYCAEIKKERDFINQFSNNNNITAPTNSGLVNNKRTANKDDDNLSVISVAKSHRSINSYRSNNSNLSHRSHSSLSQKSNNKGQIDLNKLTLDFFNKKKEVTRLDFNEEEWNAILKYKNDMNNELISYNRKLDRSQKQKMKETLFSQINEKKKRKDLDQIKENYHHENIIKTVDQLTKQEIEKINEVMKKQEEEKLIRDEQLLENKKKKFVEFQNNRYYDQKLSIISILF